MKKIQPETVIGIAAVAIAPAVMADQIVRSVPSKLSAIKERVAMKMNNKREQKHFEETTKKLKEARLEQNHSAYIEANFGKTETLADLGEI